MRAVKAGVKESNGTVRLSGERRSASMKARFAATLITTEVKPGGQYAGPGSAPPRWECQITKKGAIPEARPNSSGRGRTQDANSLREMSAPEKARAHPNTRIIARVEIGTLQILPADPSRSAKHSSVVEWRTARAAQRLLNSLRKKEIR